MPSSPSSAHSSTQSSASSPRAEGTVSGTKRGAEGLRDESVVNDGVEGHQSPPKKARTGQSETEQSGPAEQSTTEQTAMAE